MSEPTYGPSYSELRSERDRIAAELAEWQSMSNEHAENSANATSEIILLRAELAEAQKQIEELKQHIYKLVGDVPSIGKYGVIKEK